MSGSSFSPANLLEIALVSAASDPSARPQFYRELLDSKVLIVPAGEAPHIIGGVVPENTNITIANVESGGRSFVPFYSSEARLSPGTRFLQLDAKAFFELTKGAALVLNPGSAYGKEFVPEEITDLVSGSLFKPLHQHVVKKGTQVLIGQPSEYPTALVAALAKLYARMPAVRRAFVAFYHDTSRESEGGLLLAIDADDTCDFDRLSAETGIVISSVTKPQKYVDVIRYCAGKEGIASYIDEQSPFYRRNSISGLWRRLISGV